MNHKVLIIAYSYPPTNSIGTRRPEKFSKYLPIYGYEPIVITSQDSGLRFSNDNVYRFADWGFEIQNKKNVKSFFFRGIRKILFKLGILWGQNYFWYLEVLKKIDPVIEYHQPVIMWATYPPVEGLMIGVKISKRFGIPLVVDFRDGMVYEHTIREPFLVKWRNRITEAYVIKNATNIISVTDALTQYFRNAYPNTSALTISNGFDKDDWKLDVNGKLDDKINIVYTGRFTGSSFDRSILPLLKAIDLLNMNEKDKLKFHLVGKLEDKEIQILKHPKYNKLFNIVGFVNWEDSLRYQLLSDVLLLVTGAGKKSVATGKLFEYMAARKPIFALAKNNAAEEIIMKTGIGMCVAPGSVPEIANALKMIINMHPRYEFYSPNENEIEKYNRIKLTAKLAKVFDKTISV